MTVPLRSLRVTPAVVGAVTGALIGLVGVHGAAPAHAAAAVPAGCLAGNRSTEPNLDGNQTRFDAVAGVPGAVVDGVRSGAVDARLSGGRIQRVGPSYFVGVPAASGDLFGSALTTVNTEQWGQCAGLVVGAPGSDRGRGAVVITQSTDTGLRRSGAVRLTGRSAGEGFGAALGILDRDLFVSAPNRKVSGHVGAGAIDHYVIPTEAGAKPMFVGSITENTAGIPGIAEDNDHFGSVLAVTHRFDWEGPQLAVGVPGEDAVLRRDSGSVVVLQTAVAGPVTKARLLQQGYAYTPGGAEAGDRFGAALAWDNNLLYVGAPGEGIGAKRAVGAVTMYEFVSLDAQPAVRAFNQDSRGVVGVNESGDRFGAALASVNWCDGRSGIAVGVPGEDIGAIRDAGEVVVVRPGDPTITPLCPRGDFQGPRGGLGGAAEAGDQLGAALGHLESSWREDSGEAGSYGTVLLVGVPGESVGAAQHAGGVIADFGHSGISWGDSAGRTPEGHYGRVFLSGRYGSPPID